MKKILFLSSWYPRPGKPINGIFVREQAIAVAGEHDVAVLTTNLIGTREGFRRRQLHNCSVETDGPLRVFRSELTFPRTPFSVHAWLQSVNTNYGFRRVLEQWGRPDLIHAHVVFPSGYCAASLQRQYGIPVILTEHSGPFSVHLGSASLRKVVSQTLRAAKEVIAVSPALEKQIQQFLPDLKMTVIGNTVDGERFTQGVADAKSRSGPFKLLCLAGLSPEKGVQHLLEAVNLLARKNVTGFTLEIGGDGPYRPELEKLAANLELQERCRFMGLVAPADVAGLMQGCDALVLPSLGETFGVVLIEAMACGKPVIGTRCGGPEFIVSAQNGILVPPADAAALAGAIERVVVGQDRFDPVVIRQQVLERFGHVAFRAQIGITYSRVLQTQ
jgi:glycosyltransferase involved in cell wall biosynthesis